MKKLTFILILISFLSCQNKENASGNNLELTSEFIPESTTQPDTLGDITYTNIEDYYLNIPAKELFICEKSINPNQEFRKKYIVKKDIKNGYLLATDSVDFKLEMALFKDKLLNRDVIGVFSRPCNIGGQCPSSYDFWTVKDSKWINITKEVIDLENITSTIEKEKEIIAGFRLPETGTSIFVIDCENESNTGILLTWNNGKFNYGNNKNPEKQSKFSISRTKIDKPSCKIKYTVFDQNNKEVKLPEEVSAILECPQLFSLSPNGQLLFYRTDQELKMLDLSNMKSSKIINLDKKDGVSDPLWSKGNSKIVFALINETRFKYKGQFVIFNLDNGVINSINKYDAPVDYLCGSSCLAMPGEEFWFEDNEIAIGYKVNSQLSNKPEDAGYLKIK